MATYRELTYLVLDELKLSSDDSYYTEDHVRFLLSITRNFLIEQKYNKMKTQIPDSNYQTLCLNLIQVPAISGEPCEGGVYLRTEQKIPNMLNLGTPRVFPVDYFQGEFTLVSKDRLRYVGHNKYLQNIIYCAIGPDDYMYFKSSNPQYLYLEKARMSGVFENPEDLEELLCPDEKSGETPCDPLDVRFPIEDALIPTLVETVIKMLSVGIYKPEDNVNNAKDDLSDLVAYLRNNVKSDLLKEIEN